MKLLIVDDEARHRRGMASLLRSLRPEGQVLDAGDGQSALRLIREERPDIVFTDIRMPNMDGLTFLRILEQEPVKPKVVMISAYDRFEYAQTAIRHGAYDYLLKPVDADKVEQLLDRIEATLQEEAKQQTEAETMKRQLSEAADVYRRGQLLSWLLGNSNNLEWQELAKQTGLYGGGAVVLTELQLAQPLDRERQAATAALAVDLERAGISCGTVYTLPLGGQAGPVIEMVSLVGLERPRGLQELRQELEELSRSWNGRGSLRHSIGSAAESLGNQGPQAYRQARTVSDYHFYASKPCVLVEGELSPLPDKGAPVDSEALLGALQERTPDRALRQCKSAFEQLAAQGSRPPADMKEHASLLLMKIKSRNREPVDRQIGHALSQAAVAEVPACRTFSELMAVLELHLHALHQALHAGRGEREQALAAECVKWIEAHRQDPITLEQTAERFFFNPSYFSTWIKHHTGRTFTEHLLGARMARAAGLLRDSRLKIYEVAAACGYTDTKYFCRVFKKQFGLSPEGHRHAVLLQGGEEPR